MRTLMLSLLTATSLSAAAEDHYYAGFELGLTLSPEEELSRSSDSLNVDLEKNAGPIGGLFVGKKRDKMRYELEYALRKNYFSGVDVTNPGSTSLVAGSEYNAGGFQQTDSIMANVWREFLAKDEWSVLAGLGFGVSHIEIDGARSGRNNVFATESKWAPAVQAMAQVVRPIGTGLEFGLGYRYFQALANDFDTVDYKAKNHEVFARISWRFGGEKAEPVAAPAPAPIAVAQPAPAPKPAPAPAPKPVAPAPLPGPFLVFFDFDKNVISPEAAAIIQAAAKAFKTHKAVELQTTGHADRAGTDAYNITLSKKRAAAVQAALIAEGVDVSNIVISYKGESSPLVSTEDGVREWQNRRAEIKLVR